MSSFFDRTQEAVSATASGLSLSCLAVTILTVTYRCAELSKAARHSSTTTHYGRWPAVMRALVIPLAVLLAGCVSTISPDGSQRLRAADRDGVAQAKLKSATESDSPSLSVARVQEVLALLGYAPGPADGITGSATKSAMKKAATDLRLSVPDDSDTTSFARALETELTKR